MLARMAVQEIQEPSFWPPVGCLLLWRQCVLKTTLMRPGSRAKQYPALLCNRVAACVSDVAKALGVVPRVSSRLKDLLKLNLGQQTVRHPPLIPEYKEYIHSATTMSDPAYKLRAAPPVTGEQTTEQHDSQESPSKRARTTFKYGVWHSQNFCRKPHTFCTPWITIRFYTP